MSKKHRKAWRASVQRGAAKTFHDAGITPPHKLRGLARMAFIDKLAKELFLEEGGGLMDLQLRTGQLTLDAFESQMLEARDGTKAWGPDVSVYEARMNRALNERLQREKRSWLREIRKRIETALDAEEAMEAAESDAAHEDEGGEPEPEATPSEHAEHQAEVAVKPTSAAAIHPATASP